jgi:hypothetical protein
MRLTVRHLIGSAMLWGGYPERDALYLPITPAQNDGTTIHKLRVGDVPVDGFWSLTVYNSEGYLQPNQYNVYSVNRCQHVTTDFSDDAARVSRRERKAPQRSRPLIVSHRGRSGA